MAWPTTSSHSRGYGAEWRKSREIVLVRDNGLCMCDKCQGGKIRLLKANEVHHVVSKAEAKRKGWTEQKTNHIDNLISINSECHKRITMEELGRKPKTRIGDDGYPIE